MIKVISTHPGKINYYKSNNFTNSEKLNFSYCEICSIYKYKSVHHCRKCGECIEGFDHHCIWLNKCIGKYNRKIFFLFLIYTLIVIIIIILTMFPILFKKIKQGRINIHVLLILLVYILNIAIFFFLSYLIIIQIYLIVKGRVTLNMYNDNHITSNYNLGIYKNIKTVFGNEIYLCLIPCVPVFDKEVSKNKLK